MTRTTSPAGRAALMAREGCKLHAYLDTVGVPTIGVGHTGRASPPAVAMGMTITQAEAEEIFARDLAPFELAVDRAIPANATQNQRDACVSLAFNIGAKGFTGSTVVHKFQAGDIAGAADAFLMWERPPELKGRRIGERAQFLRPDGPAVAHVVPPATVAPPIARPVAPPHLPAAPAAREPGFLAKILIAIGFKKAF